MKIKILFLGTKGIPNTHGGYERFVEKLAPYLAKYKFDVEVVCPHCQDYKKETYDGVKLKYLFNFEKKIGAVGNLIYDFFSLLYSCIGGRKIIYMCAYTSAIFLWLPRIFTPNSILVTNMDGLEWKRSKYAKWQQKYLHFCEKLAIMFSHYAIADGEGIMKYLSEKYPQYCKKFVQYEYGTEYPVTRFDESILTKHNLKKYEYMLLVARIEPENNIEMIIEGVRMSNVKIPLLIVGPLNTPHANYLSTKYSDKKIIFVDGVYDEVQLFTLRKYTRINFHGHSVGGTNPSLLEALSVGRVVIVHDNVFNRGVVGKKGLIVFKDKSELMERLKMILPNKDIDHSADYSQRVKLNFTWEIINKKYKDWFDSLVINKEDSLA